MSTNNHEFDSTTDPFTVLSASAMAGWDQPIAPDAAFARTLRDRLERGATLPRGVLMSTTTTEVQTDDTAAQTIPPDVVETGGALPYLTVADAQAAIDWYQNSLGARLRGEPIVMDDGRIGHAELEIGSGAIYLATEFPESGLVAPAPDRVSVSLMLPVADTDAALDVARRGGATVQREPYEGYGTRGATIIDPFGHRWMLTGPSKTVANEPSPSTTIQRGDIVYLSLQTPDAARAARFYGAVLDWEYDPESRQVTNIGQRLGIFDGPGYGPAGSLFCVYAVDDFDRARADITAAGGQAGEITTVANDGYRVMDAVDSQGVSFSVHVPDSNDPRPEQYPSAPGEMSYLTMHTPDSARLREFYSAALGWDFTPGRIADGWEVTNARPQIGIAGGSDAARAVPMWNVVDIAAAVERVRAGGGQVITEPETQPYGIMALCADDQGAQFYLGQHF